ncbi:MAG: hypothetical protein J3K34DRAFT_436036 [Monoraphidium minutum]|nr:MAG: hypothetical protein J3K34DRAFT_436036 [Monoraphidium minutum]
MREHPRANCEGPPPPPDGLRVPMYLWAAHSAPLRFPPPHPPLAPCSPGQVHGPRAPRAPHHCPPTSKALPHFQRARPPPAAAPPGVLCLWDPVPLRARCQPVRCKGPKHCPGALKQASPDHSSLVIFPPPHRVPPAARRRPAAFRRPSLGAFAIL